MPRGALAASVLAGVLALAACGGADPVPEAENETRATYAEEIRSTEDVVRGVPNRLAAAQAEPDRLPEIAGEVAADLRDSAERLGRLEPPDEVRETHERLSDAMQWAADEADSLAQDVEEPPTDEDLERLSEALDAVDDAIDDLEAAGYDVRRRT